MGPYSLPSQSWTPPSRECTQTCVPTGEYPQSRTCPTHLRKRSPVGSSPFTLVRPTPRSVRPLLVTDSTPWSMWVLWLTCLLIYIVLITLCSKSKSLFPKCVYPSVFWCFWVHHDLTLISISSLKYLKLDKVLTLLCTYVYSLVKVVSVLVLLPWVDSVTNKL